MISRRDGIRLLGLGAIGASGLLGCTRQPAAATQITFASPAPVWWNAVPLIAQSHHLYSGVEVRTFDVPTGVRSKEAIVSGNAESGVASPNAFSATTDTDLAKLKVLASITRSSSTVSIISRRPITELAQTRIGIVQGAISEFYLIAHLIQTNQLDAYRTNRIVRVSLPPPGLVSAFANRDVDSVSAWEPFASQIIAVARDRDEEVHILRDPNLYTQHILALASTDALNSNAAGVQGLLTGLREACTYIEENRPAVATELEQFFSFPSGFISEGEIWRDVAFDYNTDRSAIRAALLRDLELARLAGVAQATEQGLDGTLSELA